jgi:hypothetical protein
LQVSISGEEKCVVDMPRQLQGIDGKLHAHASFRFSPTVSVVNFPGRFCPDSEPILVEPIKQRPRAAEFSILSDQRIVISSHDHAAFAISVSNRL